MTCGVDKLHHAMTTATTHQHAVSIAISAAHSGIPVTTSRQTKAHPRQTRNANVGWLSECVSRDVAARSPSCRMIIRYLLCSRILCILKMQTKRIVRLLGADSVLVGCLCLQPKTNGNSIPLSLSPNPASLSVHAPKRSVPHSSCVRPTNVNRPAPILSLSAAQTRQHNVSCYLFLDICAEHVL